MIVRMGLLRRRHDLSVDTFSRHWREVHGPLVKESWGTLHAYVQNLVVDCTQKRIEYKRGEFEYDAISQLLFPSLVSMRRSVNANTLEKLKADEENFLSDLVVATAFQNTIVPKSTASTAVKCMSLIRKKPSVSSAEFQDQWFNDRAALVKRLPGLLGYRQNIIIDWQVNRFSDANSEEAFGLDGIGELWFSDQPAIEHAFQSPQGKTAMMHAQEFLGEISTYVVDPVEIIPERDVFARHTA